MTATWSVNSDIFFNNVVTVKNNQPIMAVVKNNAYHYGLEYAVNMFLKAGINTFSTTSLKEAVRIRKLAPKATIFLMNAVYDFDIVRHNRIHMTLPSLQYYYANKSNLYDINVHLEYENLLHRSGFKNLSELREVLKDHEQNNQPHKMHITGLWTHFGYADEFDVPEYDTEKRAWLKVLNTLLAEGYTFDMIHAQNSASFYREQHQVLSNHTHARVGIALYGSRPYSSLKPSEIKQALTVKANVIQVREVNKGDYCGYSFAYECKNHHTRLAVVDIGYGDGILKSRAQHDVIINGKRYPIRALMMSHMFVEVDELVHARDEVVLYNNDIRIDEFTFKGVGANSEQLSAMNHDSLIKEYK
ncbi:MULTISPECIES: alanine racemase [Staphylococcus]|uniref:Alanine racemase n=1 Tax=Staphylococcus lugdunensis TaxID=28035 RepID=A0ABX6BVE5_STALU|nr:MULTISPECIES: alanine racemase [Staphylococcus]ADC87583.1 Putative alternative form of diaminopimelate epimerase [Staphylococcus lugdunensis HKU09-01]ARJ09347.1 alanine racemase [Staphylococcus lugdunensis]ARJ16380.1 alanine racemase [Staphylococcus lugdunensis]ARJ29778.1 alanine racemase [Staphylococcus lugdunensis]EKS25636.1 alanine racemase 2 [Staphylococcus lugdunensis ACS-027-V-Sch2]